MATVSVTIPDAVLSRVLDSFATAYGWTADDGTKAAFAKKCVARYVMEVARSQEVLTASTAARTAAADKAAAEIAVT